MEELNTGHVSVCNCESMLSFVQTTARIKGIYSRGVGQDCSVAQTDVLSPHCAEHRPRQESPPVCSSHSDNSSFPLCGRFCAHLPREQTLDSAYCQDIFFAGIVSDIKQKGHRQGVRRRKIFFKDQGNKVLKRRRLLRILSKSKIFSVFLLRHEQEQGWDLRN